MSENKKIAIATFGCKINQYESACIADQFLEKSFQQVDFDQDADVYVINSCTVTNRTDFKSRNAIRKALEKKKLNHKVKIIVTGCYAQRNYQEITKMGDIDLIIDNNNKSEIHSAYSSMITKFKDIFCYDSFDEMFANSMQEKSRAFIKVQDSCNCSCLYCAVPYARGNPRSGKKEQIINQIKQLATNGYKEFVIGGINLGLFGREKSDGYFLEHLLEDIEEIEGVERIRLSSIEPQLFSLELLKYLKQSTKVCPHFHIPLQSGCNSVLKRMNRKYEREAFTELIYELHQVSHFPAIGIDVIVGFPGESNEEFEITRNYLASLSFTYLHVFSYSKRSGTLAAKMKEQIHGTIMTERNRILSQLSDEKTAMYMNNLIKNKIYLTGIAESIKNVYWNALSDRFIRIYKKTNIVEKGEIISGIPIEMYRDGLLLN